MSSFSFRTLAERVRNSAPMAAPVALLQHFFDWRKNMERLDEKISSVQERRAALVAEREALLPTLLVDESADKKIGRIDRQIDDVDRELSRLGEARHLSARKVADEEAAARHAKETEEVSAVQEALVTFLSAVENLNAAEASPALSALRSEVATNQKALHDLCTSNISSRAKRVAVDAAVTAWRELSVGSCERVRIAADYLGSLKKMGLCVKTLGTGTNVVQDVVRVDSTVPYIVDHILSTSRFDFRQYPGAGLTDERALSIALHIPTNRDVDYIFGARNA